MYYVKLLGIAILATAASSAFAMEKIIAGAKELAGKAVEFGEKTLTEIDSDFANGREVAPWYERYSSDAKYYAGYAKRKTIEQVQAHPNITKITIGLAIGAGLLFAHKKIKPFREYISEPVLKLANRYLTAVRDGDKRAIIGGVTVAAAATGIGAALYFDLFQKGYKLVTRKTDSK